MSKFVKMLILFGLSLKVTEQPIDVHLQNAITLFPLTPLTGNEI